MKRQLQRNETLTSAILALGWNLSAWMVWIVGRAPILLMAVAVTLTLTIFYWFRWWSTLPEKEEKNEGEEAAGGH
jgi:uncharacterized membrane protein YhfC